MNTLSKSTLTRRFILAFICVAILWAGVAGYKVLTRSGKKRPPVKEDRLITEVQVVTAKREDILSHLTGYGTVRGKREVLIIPEVGWQNRFDQSRLQIRENGQKRRNTV